MMLFWLIGILSFLATLGLVLSVATYWPLRNAFLSVSGLPLLMLAVIFLIRELPQWLGYSIVLWLTMIFFSSSALAVIGSRLLSRASSRKERLILAIATSAALIPILVILAIGLRWG